MDLAHIDTHGIQMARLDSQTFQELCAEMEAKVIEAEARFFVRQKKKHQRIGNKTQQVKGTKELFTFHLVHLSDLTTELFISWQFCVICFGWLSDPLKWLSDLQLGDEKVTLNHLV